MTEDDFIATPFEVKFVQGATDGTFEGYGSVFNNLDAHGDVVLPGAFAASLAQRKAQGRGIPMHVMHGMFGGDGLPAGVWTDASEDERGLHLKGKLSGMDTDYGKRLYGLVKDGALGGLSIGFSVPPDGAIKGTRAGEPKRQLKAVNLHEVSLVDDPSNAMARVTEMKRLRAASDTRATSTPGKAAEAVAAAIRLHQAALKGGDSPTQDERAQLLAHLQSAHEALTGAPLPVAVKSAAIMEMRRLTDGLLTALGEPALTRPLAGFELPDLKMAMGGGKSSFGAKMQSAMDAMNAGMKDAKMTGDPDHDFVAMMIPHHVGAVAMSRLELDAGKDSAMRTLASSIISSQDAQVAEMKAWLAKYAA